jgi:hypothetical protein
MLCSALGCSAVRGGKASKNEKKSLVVECEKGDLGGKNSGQKANFAAKKIPSENKLFNVSS